MATITTESDRFPSALDNRNAAPANSAVATATAAALQQPLPESVLAEIPVVVHASHRSAASGGAGEAQTVREETTTLAISPRGTVLILSSKLSRGDLVVLGNRQNRADMLCRVVSVREQASGESYVELEFTQRSSGFWSQGAATASPAAVAAPSAAPSTIPNPTLNPVFSVSPTAAPALRPVLVPTEAAKPPVLFAPPKEEPAPTPRAAAAPSSAPALTQSVVAPVVASAVAPASAAPKAEAALASIEAVAAQEATAPEAWEQERSRQRGMQPAVEKLKELSHQPVMWVVAGCLTVIALFGEGYVLGHRKEPNSAAEVASTRAAYTAQPAAARTSIAPSLADPNSPTPDSITVTAPAIPKAPDLSATQSADAQTQHGAIRIGKMAAPIAKKGATVAASEPPVLPTSETNVGDTLLGAGSFGNALPPGGPGASVPAADPVRISQGFQGPKLISSTPPAYPSFARTQGVGGVVVVDATIDATGKVTNATAVSGPAQLRDAAVAAVRNWKYRPAELNNQPVLSHQTIDVNFTQR